MYSDSLSIPPSLFFLIMNFIQILIFGIFKYIQRPFFFVLEFFCCTRECPMVTQTSVFQMRAPCFVNKDERVW